ncbi:MAG: GerW family sporulation protein, partial [Firmicutes bacterium]|nr:GerW family sporulation protein [Bacillota bacterium]
MDELQHPIEGLMRTAMESIQEMMSVNSVVGEPVETPDGNVIIPVSRVSCGFGAGGSEFELTAKDRGGSESRPASPAFGGGSGAGMSVKPVGFLIAGKGKVRMLPVDSHALLDRLIDVTPELINQIQG